MSTASVSQIPRWSVLVASPAGRHEGEGVARPGNVAPEPISAQGRLLAQVLPVPYLDGTWSFMHAGVVAHI